MHLLLLSVVNEQLRQRWEEHNFYLMLARSWISYKGPLCSSWRQQSMQLTQGESLGVLLPVYLFVFISGCYARNKASLGVNSALNNVTGHLPVPTAPQGTDCSRETELLFTLLLQASDEPYSQLLDKQPCRQENTAEQPHPKRRHTQLTFLRYIFSRD